MTGRGNWLRVLALALAGLLSLVLLAPEVWSALVANVERVEALRWPDSRTHEGSLDEAAWDAGWRGLCGLDGEEPTLDIPSSERALRFNALASIDGGNYAAARAMLRRLAAQGLAINEPNASAYAAALDMEWVTAAEAYEPQPTPRHERWWGTVFYLAAQQRMFEGDFIEAAKLYRRADAAYGEQGPYLGLGVAGCLAQQDRPTEAWDAYRRALVVMPPEEALGHLARFEELRLEGLRAWHERQPGNGRVADWLSFYEGEFGQQAAVALPESAGSEALPGAPVPQVPLKLELEGGRVLLGFDYRVQDLETGPFLVVDFYLREGQEEQPIYWRVSRTVLNQAANGAFAWDAVPDGVRPVGWHGLVYGDDLTAIEYRDLSAYGRWLCMDGGAIQDAFGLQSVLAAVGSGAPLYIQGGDAYVHDGGRLVHGRRWFGGDDTPYPYSYLVGGHLQDQVQSMSGIWIPVDDVEAVAVWLYSLQAGQACARNVYLIRMPDLDHTE